MNILIENEQTKIKVNEYLETIVKKAAVLCLELENFKTDCEISILYTDDERIREINREHRHIDKPTDVLSFPMVDMKNGRIISEEGDYDLEEECLMLGDIVISLETAEKQASEYGHSFERELAFLVTHGVFHLLGYDHEEESDEKIMFKKQEDVLTQMNLTRGQV